MKSEVNLIREVYGEMEKEFDNNIQSLNNKICEINKCQIKLELERDISWQMYNNGLSEEELLEKTLKLESQKNEFQREIDITMVKKKCLQNAVERLAPSDITSGLQTSH